MKLSPEQDAIVQGDASQNGPYNPDDRGPLAEALWKGILAAGAACEPEGHRSSSRSTAHFSTTPVGETVSAVYTYYLNDGTRLHRRVTITAIDVIDSNDGYWDQVKPDDRGAVRTDDGRHFFIGEATSAGLPNHCKGFGGHKWHVKFHDGKSVYTDNLWSQGVIPPKHRERLAPNAELHSYGHSDCCRDEPM
jgi:hypothetical protein